MSVWVDRQDAGSVVATHEVEQAAASDEGSRGDEVEAWVDGIAHTPSPHIERIHEIPNRQFHLRRILCSLVVSSAEVSISVAQFRNASLSCSHLTIAGHP